MTVIVERKRAQKCERLSRGIVFSLVFCWVKQVSIGNQEKQMSNKVNKRRKRAVGGAEDRDNDDHDGDNQEAVLVDDDVGGGERRLRNKRKVDYNNCYGDSEREVKSRKIDKTKTTAKPKKPEANKHIVKKQRNEGMSSRNRKSPEISEDDADIGQEVDSKGENDDVGKEVDGRMNKKQKTNNKKRNEVEQTQEQEGHVDASSSTVDFNCTRKTINGAAWNFKITSWNVNGIRSCLKKGFFVDYIRNERPHVLCLQETRVESDSLLPKDFHDELKEYKYKYWLGSGSNSADGGPTAANGKRGYAGVAILAKIKPITVTYGIDDIEHDRDGRCITVEYEEFYIVSVYVTNAGRKLVTLDKRLEWNDLLLRHVQKLDAAKPVIVCGDMNVAHQEIDLRNPQTNKRNAGFTAEERDGMTTFLDRAALVDSFRQLYPEERDAFTFWTSMHNARQKDIGWRLDYFLVSKRYMENVCDSTIRKHVMGSDHCPITLFVSK